MNMKTNEELSVLIGKATAGDKESLETIIRIWFLTSPCGCWEPSPTQRTRPRIFS